MGREGRGGRGEGVPVGGPAGGGVRAMDRAGRMGCLRWGFGGCIDIMLAESEGGRERGRESGRERE